jgi:4'-phosphopantetheinyl transferase
MVAIYWTVGGAALCADPTSIEAILSPAERLYYQTLRFERRRADWVLGRWVAKHLLRATDRNLSAYTWQQINILRTPQGAPQVWVTPDAPYPVALSISHRKGQAACALAPVAGMALGVDLEAIEPRAQVFVEDFFTPGERRAVARVAGQRRHLAVTLIWSLKEAVLKALRVGLSWDTRRVDVDLGDDLNDPETWHAASVSVQGVSGSWRAWWRCLGDQVLTLAVCAQRGQWPTALTYIPLSPYQVSQVIGSEGR